MSSVLHTSYQKCFVQPDMTVTRLHSNVDNLPPPGDINCKGELSGIHALGILSIFRLSSFRKQHAIQTGLQASTIASLNKTLDDREKNLGDLKANSTALHAQLNDVKTELDTARHGLAEERKLKELLVVSLDVLRREKEKLVAAQNALLKEAKIPFSSAETKTHCAPGASLGLATSPSSKSTSQNQGFSAVAETQLCSELSRVTAELANMKQAYESALANVSRLEEECTSGAASLDLLNFRFAVAERQLSLANARLQDTEDLEIALRDQTAKASDLAAQLLQKDQELGALHQARFALECEFKKTKEVVDEEKADLETSIFAVELERDLLLKSEAELTQTLKEKTESLSTAEACLIEALKVKDIALSDLLAARSRIVTLEKDQDRLAELRAETARLQTILQERALNNEEVVRLKTSLLVRDDIIKKLENDVSDLHATLSNAEERCDSVQKQLQGECEAHHETRNDLGLIIRRLAALTAEKDDAQTKLKEAQDTADEAKTALNTTTRRLSLELDQMKTREDVEVEAERQEKIVLEVRAQSAVEELTLENKLLEQSKKGLEEALLGKVDRCEALEREVASLQERLRLMEKERGDDWHTVVPGLPALGYDAERAVPSSPHKWSSRDKENMHSGSMHDGKAPRVGSVRRASTMTTDSTISNATLVTSSDSRTFSSRVFNSQSLRRFFNPSQMRKAAADESPAVEYPDPFDDALRLAESEFTSPALI
ncbi:hypothetical protein EIP91_010857 [Steccherinum ochraceum]|uniref:Uncharacterized protein n=1 Tax=Steccherinum ochraceum TaxID=92696 RepID=A0A4R0R2A1_9APHY|nr:hypothetical protein EIP91_010857 [Steccherinum ochraceum]